MVSRCSSAVRGLLLWIACASATIGGAWWLAPSIRSGAVVLGLGSGASRSGAAGFADVVTAVAGAALVACAAWAWVVVGLVLLETARGTGPVRGIPAWARGLVVGTCGLALLGTAPAMAVTNGGHHETPSSGVAAALLSGLPFPDRATDGQSGLPPAPTERPTGPDDVVVRAGDSLWGITAGRLGSEASEAEVATAVRALYAANRASVGADPDLIHPGLRLTLPASLTAPTVPDVPDAGP